jgi:hypothetical protein
MVGHSVADNAFGKTVNDPSDVKPALIGENVGNTQVLHLHTNEFEGLPEGLRKLFTVGH